VDEHPNSQFTLFPGLSTQVTQSHRADGLSIGSNGSSSILSHRDGLVPGHDDVRLGTFFAGGRCVGRDLMKTFSDHLWYEKEMVIMNDDQITGLVDLGDSLSEQ
jgi:hypothetical protein